MKLLKISHIQDYNTGSYYTVEHGMLHSQLITSLDGYPICADVSIILIGSNKMLTSLVGGPLHITKAGEYDYNNLKNLKGGPIVVGQAEPWSSISGVSISDNSLTSLEGGPLYIRGYFTISYNNLTNLKGAPLCITGSLDISFNPLTTLEGLPLYIGGSLYVDSDTYVKCIAKKMGVDYRPGSNIVDGRSIRMALKKYYNCILEGEVYISDEGWI